MTSPKLLSATALAIAALTSAAMANRSFAADDEYFGLPDASGREEVIAYCGACHSMRLVVQQGLTRSDWAELLTWMYKEQGMEPLEAADEKLVLDYLGEHIDPDSQKQRLRQRGILR
jgi:cytochrome c